MSNEAIKNFDSVESKLVNGLCRNYGISNDEMGQILGLGKGQDEVIASFRSGKTGLTEEFTKNIGRLAVIFGTIEMAVQRENVAQFIRDEKFDGRTIMEMLLTNDLDVLQHRHLLRLTGASYVNGKLNLGEI